MLMKKTYAQSFSPFSSALSDGDIFRVSCNDSIVPTPAKIANGQETQFSHHHSCFPGLGVNNNNFDVSSLSTANSSFSLTLRLLAASLNTGLCFQEPYKGFSAPGCREQLIDILFKVHKAIRRDLEYLSSETARVSDGDDTFLHQFIGRFCLLWGLYKAHGNSEDNIVYPALESREALHNITHSYKLDHEQQERLFENISSVLSELSQIHANLKSAHMKNDIGLSAFGVYDSECIGKYYELSTKLQIMCKSLQMIVEKHMLGEEHELWPLFGMNFSVEEQHRIIGFILGTSSAEVLKLLLPWVLSALSQDEQNKMMVSLKHVTINTMFSEWLNDCWKGTSITMLPTGTSKADISSKGEFRGSMVNRDQMLRPHKNDNKKVYPDLNSDHMTKTNLQNFMTSYWMAAQHRLPQTLRGKDCVGENSNERSPSFRDPEKKVFGCEHYKRNCKIRAACCGKLFTCSVCHDNMSDHSMDRKAISEMMCMRCLNIQPIGPVCRTPSCNGFPMAKYHCNICKLFDDQRNVYHCSFCNLCRVGKGLGLDYFHCISCNCCLTLRLLKHECKEKCLETSCPVCNEFLFTATMPVRALPCGHYIHSTCFEACNPILYTCIVCSQSSGDKMKASAESVVLVDDDGHGGKMKLYNHGNQGKVPTTSWIDENSEKRAFRFARFWANRLYPFLLWFGTPFLNHGKVQRIGKEVQNVVEGNKAKDRFFLCFFLVCSLVVFCIMSSLIVLTCIQIVRGDRYVFPW